MTTPLGTVSEMTKGWVFGELTDSNEKVAMGALRFYSVSP